MTGQNYASLSEFKAFADDKINGTQKLNFVFEMAENIAGKGQNTGTLIQHFPLFLQNPQFKRQSKQSFQILLPFPNKPLFYMSAVLFFLKRLWE